MILVRVYQNGKECFSSNGHVCADAGAGDSSSTDSPGGSLRRAHRDRGSTMAANFWTSSHCKQLLDPEDVDLVPAADRERGITPEEFRLIKIHMSFHIWRLAQQVKVRQRLGLVCIT